MVRTAGRGWRSGKRESRTRTAAPAQLADVRSVSARETACSWGCLLGSRYLTSAVLSAAHRSTAEWSRGQLIRSEQGAGRRDSVFNSALQVCPPRVHYVHAERSSLPDVFG